MKISLRKFALALVVATGAFASASAAATYNFGNIAGGDTVGDALAANFTLEVTDLGGNQVMFEVESATLIGTYFIGAIFIDDSANVLGGESTAYSDANSVGDVNYLYDSKPKNFPQGNTIGFDTTASYNAQNGNGNSHAVQPGESAAFIFTGNYNDMIAALDDGSLSFGIHVQGIGRGSDSFVAMPNNPPPGIPLPAGGFLLLSALVGLGVARKRMKT